MFDDRNSIGSNPMSCHLRRLRGQPNIIQLIDAEVPLSSHLKDMPCQILIAPG